MRCAAFLNQSGVDADLRRIAVGRRIGGECHQMHPNRPPYGRHAPKRRSNRTFLRHILAY